MPATTITAEGAAPIPYDPERTAISQMYVEPGMIADQVLPPIARLGVNKFDYFRWKRADAFVLPDNRLGRTGMPTQVEFEGEKVTDSCEDYGLMDLVPQTDVDAAASAANRTPEEADPLNNATIMLTHLQKLAREVRVANLVFGANSYDATLRTALQAANRFDNDASDPVGIIEDQLNKPLIRPNVGVIGQEAWSKLRRHPAVVSARNRNDGEKGMATRREVAELFELDEILVGRSRVASSAEGQDLALKRAWGKSFALIHRGGPGAVTPGGEAGSERAGMMPNVRVPTFGFTAPYVPLEVRTAFKPDRGVKGAHMVAVVESCKEVICGGDAFGAILLTVIA